MPSLPASAAKHLCHPCQGLLPQFSSLLLLSVTCLLISWANRQITVLPRALEVSVLRTKSGSQDAADGRTQQVSREASRGADELGAVDLLQPVPHVGVQLRVQRFYLEAEEEKETNYFLFALHHSSFLNREPQRCL